MYFIIGGMAVLAAEGTGRVTGWHGALRELFARPVGKVLVVAVVVGLAGHAVWSLAQAAVDPEERIRARRLPEGETPAGRWGYRICRLFEGLFHVALVVGGIGLITGLRAVAGASPDEPHVGRTQRWVAWLMSLPAGRWAVALTGAGVVGFAVFEMVRAWRTRVDVMLSLGGMRPGWRRVAVDVSRFGIAARGVVFALVGMWLMVAAWDANAREAKGVGAALRELRGRPEGPWAFIVVAVGLMAYGIYEFVRAGWRRIGGR
jgi:type IV secretory pathway VirB2 component (pilin)